MFRLRVIGQIVFLSFFVLGSVRCSNLLYYPDHVMYVDEELMEYKPEDCVLKLESGADIHGWYFTAKQKPKGIIVFFHGNGQNRTSHIVDVYWLVKEGYNLFAVEYPGYGETDGVPTPESTVQSGHAALRYIAKRNPDLPLIVYGQSLGGAVALRTVLDLKKEIPISLVVANSTFLSYRRVGQKVMSKSWVTWLFQFLPQILLSDKFAPGDGVSKLNPIPLLVIHDKKDPIVPFELGQELFNKASQPKEFWTLEDGFHTQPFSGPDGKAVKEKFLAKLAEIISHKN